MSEISRVSRRFRIELPKRIRSVLNLKAEDFVQFDIQNQQVVLRRADSFDSGFARALQGTLDEWNSPADEIAYRDL